MLAVSLSSARDLHRNTDKTAICRHINMGGSSSTPACSVCKAVPTSPCVLSCTHSFCLKCLEEKVGGHKKFILCPVCNSPSEMPATGVAEGPTMCHVHGEERVIFQCRQCDQVICIRCKLTRHEGHFTQDLSEVAAQGKERIKTEMPRLRACIRRMEQKLLIYEEREKNVRDKIQARHDRVVAVAGAYRDSALKKLEKIADTNLAGDPEPVKNRLNALVQLQDRAQRALSSTCDTDVLHVEREMTRGQGSTKRLTELEAGSQYTSYFPVLHNESGEDNDLSKDVKDYIQKYIGSPVGYILPSHK